jgi:hypothetical protein
LNPKHHPQGSSEEEDRRLFVRAAPKKQMSCSITDIRSGLLKESDLAGLRQDKLEMIMRWKNI